MVRRCLALTVALVALAVSAAPAVAAEGGTTEPRGNSEAAKLCQKGGFETFKFANAGECSSFVAQGGTLVLSFEDTCKALDNAGYNVRRGTEACFGYLLDVETLTYAQLDGAEDALTAACSAQGGTSEFDFQGEYDIFRCYPA